MTSMVIGVAAFPAELGRVSARAQKTVLQCDRTGDIASTALKVRPHSVIQRVLSDKVDTNGSKLRLSWTKLCGQWFCGLMVDTR